MIRRTTLIRAIAMWPDEQPHVVLEPRRGQLAVRIQRHYLADGAWRPGKGGVVVNVRWIRELQEALAIVAESVREAGG